MQMIGGTGIAPFIEKSFSFGFQRLSYWGLITALECRHRFCGNRRLDKGERADVIISLTSYPARFASLHLTVESLFRQTLRPSRILLWLSEEEALPATLPPSIRALERKGLTVVYKEGNLKSYKKLVYALREFPESPVITVDDDILYPKDFVAKLYAKYRSKPDVIWAYRACQIGFAAADTLTPYRTWGPPHPEPSFLTFATSGGGVLYPPRSLYPEVTNEQAFLSLCPTADDIWFNAMAILNGTKVGLVNRQSTDFITIASAQRSALWHRNVGDNLNDVQLQRVFERYNLYAVLRMV